jgi:hypothetical protein
MNPRALHNGPARHQGSPPPSWTKPSARLPTRQHGSEKSSGARQKPFTSTWAGVQQTCATPYTPTSSLTTHWLGCNWPAAAAYHARSAVAALLYSNINIKPTGNNTLTTRCCSFATPRLHPRHSQQMKHVTRPALRQPVHPYGTRPQHLKYRRACGPRCWRSRMPSTTTYGQ